MKKRMKGLSVVEVAYLSFVGSPPFMLEFLFDLWERKSCNFGDEVFLSLSRTNSPLLRIYVFETYRI